MNFEDHFSQLASTYSRYRPTYPPALFEYLSGCCKDHSLVGDCGTGNGQAALELIKHFDKVFATDASKEQLDRANYHPKITYFNETAEKVSLENSSTDLVTVAVAVHWFDLPKFYNEVKRVLKPGGVISVWTYHLPNISAEINNQLFKYYSEILKNYWPQRFHYLDEMYKTLPFPFTELTPPNFEMTADWNLDQVSGFLRSWSGSKNYMQATGNDPVLKIWDDLKNAWGDESIQRSVKWPLYSFVFKDR